MTEASATAETLPEWAEERLPGRCGCGARLCRPICWCGDHVACSASGVEFTQCPLPPEQSEDRA